MFQCFQPQEDGSVKANLICPEETWQTFASVAAAGKYVKVILENKEKYVGERSTPSSS